MRQSQSSLRTLCLNSRLQFSIKALEVGFGLLPLAPVRSEQERQQARELFLVSQSRVSRRALGWLEVEGVHATEEHGDASLPVELFGRVRLRVAVST